MNPGQKTYSIQSGAEAQKNLQFYSGASPCPPAGATCKDAGTEALNGRSAERWEITQSIQGQTLLTRVWVDTKLHVWTKVEVLTGATLVAGTELQDIRGGPASRESVRHSGRVPRYNSTKTRRLTGYYHFHRTRLA